MAHPAMDFLLLLDPSPQARFNIETYTDKKEKPKPDPLNRRFPVLSRIRWKNCCRSFKR